jgi:hypothetical protein
MDNQQEHVLFAWCRGLDGTKQVPVNQLQLLLRPVLCLHWKGSTTVLAEAPIAKLIHSGHPAHPALAWHLLERLEP